MTLSEELCERARSYEQSGPSAKHTADMLWRAAGEIDRLKAILTNLHNRSRHEFSAAVEAAADKLFAECGANHNGTFRSLPIQER